MTFQQWADQNGACRDGSKYLTGKRATWATWIQSCGDWRGWVRLVLRLPNSARDLSTDRSVLFCTCPWCVDDQRATDKRNRRNRKLLNEPARYAALKREWRTVVLPALRKAGVK